MATQSCRNGRGNNTSAIFAFIVLLVRWSRKIHSWLINSSLVDESTSGFSMSCSRVFVPLSISSQIYEICLIYVVCCRQSGEPVNRIHPDTVHTRNNFGNRAFSAAGPRVWNNTDTSDGRTRHAAVSHSRWRHFYMFSGTISQCKFPILTAL